jgi:hypothetical protein
LTLRWRIARNSHSSSRSVGIGASIRCQSRISSASAASLNALTPARRRAALIIALKICGNPFSLGACASVVIVTICPVPLSVWYFAIQPAEKLAARGFNLVIVAPAQELFEYPPDIEMREGFSILQVIEIFLRKIFRESSGCDRRTLSTLT